MGHMYTHMGHMPTSATCRPTPCTVGHPHLNLHSHQLGLAYRGDRGYLLQFSLFLHRAMAMMAMGSIFWPDVVQNVT